MVKVKIFDIFIIVLLLTVSLLPLVHQFNNAQGNARLRVTVGNKVEYYSLHEDREVNIAGNGYSLTLRITDGTATVIDSDCEDKICIKSGRISRAGSAIVCLPAETVIEIITSEEMHDAVAG